MSEKKLEKRSKAEWAAVIATQARSGKSGAGFCREHGIHYKLFLYYRSKHTKSDDRALALAGTAGASPLGRQRGFVPIRVEGCCGMRFRFPRGLVVESDAAPPAVWVAELAARFLGFEAGSC